MEKFSTPNPFMAATGLVLLTMFFVSACTKAPEMKEMLAVVEKGNSSLGFYTPSGERVAGIRLDTFPHEMRFSPDGSM